MDDNPSPQSVGREFVRQYYTMLHEAPHFLHRFYSHDSSFLHGSISDKIDHVAVGQAEIFQHIQSLNFKNCHAKIRQVDSQLSINNSVIIQVVGELSNNGLPLRRFVQTFLLAPQSQKKFYVHNDIFRYQEDLMELGSQVAVEMTYQNQEMPNVSNEAVGAENGEMDDLTTDYVENSHTVDNAEFAPQIPINVLPVVESSLVVDTSPVVNHQLAQGMVNEIADDLDEIAVKSEEIQKEIEAIALPDKKALAGPSAPAKLSWAAMASKNTGTANVVNSFSPDGLKPQATIKPEPKNGITDAHRNPKIEGDVLGVEEDGGRGQIYPDNQQVFVGNLPHNMLDIELKEFFGKFGNVIDIRINRKTNSNLPILFSWSVWLL